MENTFVRTAIALVLISSFWISTVETAAAEWVNAAGQKVGEQLGDKVPADKQCGAGIERFLCACHPHPRPPPILRYIQFVQERDTDGYCYYYQAGDSSGAGSRYTWRWDD